MPDISCEHCKETLEGAVGGLDGVSSVAVDVQWRVVTVTHDPANASAESMAATIEDQGYDVAHRNHVS